MITLHHLENSRSQRILWLLEELGLPYQLKRYARDGKTQLAPPELLAVHALGKSPVLTDERDDARDDERGEGRSDERSADNGAGAGAGVGAATVVVAESGAIIEYLLDVHGNGRLRPAAGTRQRRQFTYWLHFAEGSAMPPLLMKLVFDKVKNAPVPFFIKPVLKGIAAKVNSSFLDPNIQRQLDYMEAELTQAPWFAGPEFSAADIQMSFPLEAAAARAGLSSSRPKLMDWLARIHARPAYRRALDVGGPYSILG